LGISLLCISGCSEGQAPVPELTKPDLVVSKSISQPGPAGAQKAAPGDAGKKKAGVSDLKPARDSVKNRQAGTGISGGENLQKAVISTPLEKYDSKGRVDPFVPLIAEKNASPGSGSPVDSKPRRVLTPLEKLTLSQIKLVAVIEMQGRAIAMVEEAGGKGYEVAIGTYIGPDGGRVTSITRKGIQIEIDRKDYKGKHRKRYEEIIFHKSKDGE